MESRFSLQRRRPGRLPGPSRPTSDALHVLDVRDGSRRELQGSAFSARVATFSPDGRLLAYQSARTGFAALYVPPYPGPGPEIAVSPDGGSQPVWGSRGYELYYRGMPDGEFRLVTLEIEPRLRVLEREELFRGAEFWQTISGTQHYDVHSDGQRLLVLNQREEDAGSSRLRVVLDWFEELEHRAPASR